MVVADLQVNSRQFFITPCMMCLIFSDFPVLKHPVARCGHEPVAKFEVGKKGEISPTQPRFSKLLYSPTIATVIYDDTLPQNTTLFLRSSPYHYLYKVWPTCHRKASVRIMPPKKYVITAG